MQAFFDTFFRYVAPTDTLIFAISGGVDSMVLLDIAKKHHPREKIIVAHFDHLLRGVESDMDRELVENTCKRDGIIFEAMKVDIARIAKEERGSIEAVARRERYKFLETIRTQYNARFILTAHHADDQAETILINLTKGAKIRGLSGMQVLSGTLFRPLLSITKSDILDYARTNSVYYREDLTNLDTDYDRNNIRHNIVPILRELNPSLHETLGELAEYMQELGEFVNGYIDTWLISREAISGKEKSFLIAEFLSLTLFLQREVVSVLYSRAHSGSTQGLSRGMIAEIIRFITEGSNSYGIRDIKNLHLERRGERVYY